MAPVVEIVKPDCDADRRVLRSLPARGARAVRSSTINANCTPASPDLMPRTHRKASPTGSCVGHSAMWKRARRHNDDRREHFRDPKPRGLRIGDIARIWPQDRRPRRQFAGPQCALCLAGACCGASPPRATSTHPQRSFAVLATKARGGQRDRQQAAGTVAPSIPQAVRLGSRSIRRTFARWRSKSRTGHSPGIKHQFP